MSFSDHSRSYTRDEIRALRAAFPGTGVTRGEGPAHFAGGNYWPSELRNRADGAERIAPLLRIAADALEREIAADPRTEATR